MAELYPSNTDLEALSDTIGDSGLPHMKTTDWPFYHNKLRRADWLDRILTATSASLRVYKDGALTFGVKPGRYFNGDVAVNYAGAAAQSLTDDDTNYIYLTAAGTLTVNTTDFPVPSMTPHIPLATILTASGDYDIADDIIDYRGRGLWTVCGSAAANTNSLDWQESVKDRDLAAPPGSPSLGDRYIVASGGSGDWSGLDGHIVEYNGTSWTDITPTEGALTLVEDEDILVGYNGSAWIDLGSLANIRDLTDGGNADTLHTHATAGIEDNAVTAAKIAAAVAGDGLSGGAGSALAVNVDDSSIEIDTDTLQIKDAGVTAAKIAAAVAGDGLAGGAGSALSVNVDDSSIEINADALRIKAAGVTNAMLAGDNARSKLLEETLVRYQVPLMTCRNENGSVMKDDADTPLTSDFMIVAGGWGSGTTHLRGASAISNTKTSTLCREFVLPAEYVAAGDVELNIHARYTGSGTAGTKTIDAEVYELTDAGAVGSDLNVDDAEDLTTSFADTTGFTLNAADLVAGDRIKIFVRTVLQETVGSDTVHVELGSIELQLDIKG